MEGILKLLQKEVYKLDYQIGDCAKDLRSEIPIHSENSTLEYYNRLSANRVVILDCIEKLKALK